MAKTSNGGKYLDYSLSKRRELESINKHIRNCESLETSKHPSTTKNCDINQTIVLINY
jgi:hypothetical protein